MRRVAILVSGAGSNMIRLVEALQAADSPGEPVVVLSNDPGADALARAEGLGVPALAVDHTSFGRDRAAFDAALDAALAPHAPDVICLAGFMRIFGPDFVARREGRILNVHPSLLPAYKGLDTHARVLAAGEAEHGCTVHIVTAALDDGPVLGQARVPVAPGDTPHSLGARVRAAEHRLYPAVLLRYLRGERTPLLLG